MSVIFATYVHFTIDRTQIHFQNISGILNWKILSVLRTDLREKWVRYNKREEGTLVEYSTMLAQTLPSSSKLDVT